MTDERTPTLHCQFYIFFPHLFIIEMAITDISIIYSGNRKHIYCNILRFKNTSDNLIN